MSPFSPITDARKRLIHENEIPSLPTGWDVQRFRLLFRESKERNGDQPVGDMLSVSEYHGVIPREYDNEEQRRTDDELSNYRVVRPGQLAVNTMWLNHLALGVSDHLGHVSPAYAVYHISPKLERKFVHYLLRSHYYLKIYLRYLYGIRPNSLQIKTDDWNSIPIIVPPIETQKSIADFLDRETARIDRLIEKKQRLAGLLHDQFVAFREGLLGDGIPTRLKFLAKFITSGSRDWGDLYADEGELFVRIGNLSGKGVDLDLSQKTFVQLGERSEGLRTKLKAADLLVSITANLGSVAIVGPEAEGGYINQHVALVRLFDPGKARFVAYSLQTKRCADQFAICGYGGTKQGLSLTDVKEVSILLPSTEEQVHKAYLLDKRWSLVSKAYDQLHQSVERLRELRAALITAAVTGQIEIREKLPATSSNPDRSTFRVIVGAEIVHQHQGNPKFGRVKLQKELYLAEAHLGIDGLHGNYLREAAGPLDRVLIEETERGLESAGFYRASQRDGTGTAVTYAPLGKAGQHSAELETLLGAKADELRSLIAMLRDLDRREVEAVATLYAVWNDSLMDGDEPDDAAIINGVLTEWHTEKGEKFRTDDLSRWLGWMKRHSLTPRGQGPRTAHTRTRDMFA